jgi:hypothetical protein
MLDEEAAEAEAATDLERRLDAMARSQRQRMPLFPKRFQWLGAGSVAG